MMAMRVAIFGLGYTGRHLAQQWRERYRLSFYSRSSSLDGSPELDVSLSQDVLHLADRGLPHWDAAVVTLPAHHACPEFWDLLLDACPHVIVYGTTGIYARQGLHREPLHEESVIDQTHPRATIETKLQQRGATILRLAGIYGPARNPRDWLQRGLVGPDDRQVNFIHVTDIATITAHVIDARPADRLLNLADGQAHSWLQIAEFLHRAGYLTHLPPPKTTKADSVVEIGRLLRAYPGVRPRDFWLMLDELCATR